jgi:hypothetical protein
MKMVYKRKDADFEDRFSYIRIYDCTGENKKLPSSVTVDFDLVEGEIPLICYYIISFLNIPDMNLFRMLPSL